MFSIFLFQFNRSLSAFSLFSRLGSVVFISVLTADRAAARGLGTSLLGYEADDEPNKLST